MYLKQFLREEDGVETIEWIAILAVSAGIIAVVGSAAKAVKGKLKGVANAI